jgi:hypothetical protein
MCVEGRRDFSKRSCPFHYDYIHYDILCYHAFFRKSRWGRAFVALGTDMLPRRGGLEEGHPRAEATYA